MIKELIKFDESKFNSEISTLNDFINEVNTVIQLYNGLQFGKYTKDDFQGLFFDTENFLYEKIMKNQPSEAFGMKINKRKFFNEFLVKPQGYFDMIKAMEHFQKIVTIKLKYRPDITDSKNYFNLFSQSSNGEFKIKDEEIKLIRNKYETYVTTERGLLAFKLATAINDFLQDGGSKKMVINSRKDLEDFAGNAIIFHQNSTDINIAYIEFNNRR